MMVEGSISLLQKRKQKLGERLQEKTMRKSCSNGVSDIAVAKPRYQMLRDNIKTGRRRQVSRKWASGTRHYVALVALVPLVALRSTCSTVALVCSTSSTSSTVAPTSWMQSTRPADIPQIRKWVSGIIWDLGNELQYLSCPPNHLPMKICIS